MFRAPQVLTWSCPIRPSFLLQRESHLFVSSEHSGAGWQGVRAAKERRYEGICACKEGVSTKTASCLPQLSLFTLDCENHQLRFQKPSSKAILSSCHPNLHHHHQQQQQQHCPPQVSVSAKAKSASDSSNCTVVKAVSTYRECLSNTTCLQTRRRPWDNNQASLSSTSKTQCAPPQSRAYRRQHFVRPVDLSTRTPWISNHFHSRPQSSYLLFHQTRAVHQAAPHVAVAWRDCLSPENENRCRRRLGPNSKLYEPEKERKGSSQRRWASVLVSLCSVGGEPAFLFTLRSSTLKGRHKGDVSFAGGKSDPSDRDVVATALREAQEELGVNVTTGQVWGLMKPLRDMSGMMIAPVLANLGPLEELSFKPNPGEVEEIFTLSLSHLCNPQNRGYTHFRTGDKYGYTLPVFRNGKHRVWGLTAVALDHSLKLIVPP